MQRKDIGQKYLKCFCEIIYKEKAKENENVNVRIYDYISDEEFNETKVDFRGNRCSST